MLLHTIDLEWLGHAQAIATYVLATDAGIVLIDPGPHSTVQTLCGKLDALGVKPADVREIVVTHIHLDHAGAAWWWAQHAGTAACRPTVHVHAFGARHLIDPAKLSASANRIYGEQMKPMWGELQPISEAQVRPVDDGDVLRFGAVALHAIETPGHARHHHAYAATLDGEAVCFCGDIAAMIVPGNSDFVSLPTPPPEFDLEGWLASIAKLTAHGFDALYPTHFGRISQPPDAWLSNVARALRDHVGFIRDALEAGWTPEAIRTGYRIWLEQLAADAGLQHSQIARHVTDSLVGMNCTGILRYFQQHAAGTSQP